MTKKDLVKQDVNFLEYPLWEVRPWQNSENLGILPRARLHHQAKKRPINNQAVLPR